MRRVLCVVVVLTGWATVSPAAEPAATPAAAGQTYCPLQVGYAEYLGAQGGGSVYAFGFLTESGGGRASGVLTLYSRNDRYEIPFKDLKVAALNGSWNEADPLPVRFADNVEIDAAYVSRLDVPEPIACPIGMVWRRQEIYKEHVEPEFDEKKAIGEAQKLVPTTVMRRVREGEPACAVPDAPAKTVKEGKLEYPPMAAARLQGGKAEVMVLINPDGSVGGFQMLKSSGDDFIDTATRNGAISTTFSPERFRCQNVFTEVIYGATFTIDR